MIQKDFTPALQNALHDYIHSELTWFDSDVALYLAHTAAPLSLIISANQVFKYIEASAKKHGDLETLVQ